MDTRRAALNHRAVERFADDRKPGGLGALASLLPFMVFGLVSSSAPALEVAWSDFPASTVVEDFEGFVGSNDFLVVPSPFLLNDVTYTASIGDLILTSRRACHDRTCLQHGSARAEIEIAFNQPITMAGTFVGATGPWATTVYFLADDLSELGSIDLAGDANYLFAGWETDRGEISRIRVGQNRANLYLNMRIDDVHYLPETVVPIDIKPDSDANSMNPNSKGVISVAILTTEDFDAATIDADAVWFGPAEAEKAHKKAHVIDVDADGDLDLLLHFRTQDTGIASGDIEACLTGQTFDGVSITGCDSVRTVPPN